MCCSKEAQRPWAPWPRHRSPRVHTRLCLSSLLLGLWCQPQDGTWLVSPGYHDDSAHKPTTSNPHCWHPVFCWAPGLANSPRDSPGSCTPGWVGNMGGRLCRNGKCRIPGVPMAPRSPFRPGLPGKLIVSPVSPVTWRKLGWKSSLGRKVIGFVPPVVPNLSVLLCFIILRQGLAM